MQRAIILHEPMHYNKATITYILTLRHVFVLVVLYFEQIDFRVRYLFDFWSFLPQFVDLHYQKLQSERQSHTTLLHELRERLEQEEATGAGLRVQLLEQDTLISKQRESLREVMWSPMISQWTIRPHFTKRLWTYDIYLLNIRLLVHGKWWPE